MNTKNRYNNKYLHDNLKNIGNITLFENRDDRESACWLFTMKVHRKNDFIEKMKLCVEDLKQIEWDMFYMGGEPNAECNSISNNLAKCTTGLYGTHAYAINECFYDKILSIPFTSGVIDTLFLFYDRNNKNYVMSKDLLVLQDEDFVSDLWHGKIKRTEIYQEAYKKWIK
jgi:hypothetical protein